MTDVKDLTVTEPSESPLEKIKDGLLSFIDRISRSFSGAWPVLTFLGSALGILSLYIYVKTIGRTDVFMASVTVQASLFVWLFLVVFVTFAYIFILIATPSLFGLAISMFGKNADDKKKAAQWLSLPVIAGFIVFAVGIIAHPSANPLWTMLWIALVTACSLVLVLKSTSLRRAALSAMGNKENFSLKMLETAGFIGVVWLLVMFTVVSGSSPALLLMRADTGDLENGTVGYVAFIVVLAMAASLIPIVVFYVSSGKAWTRIFYAFISLIAVFALVVTVSSGTLGMITYSAAGLLGVRQSEPATYIVGDAYKSVFFDETVWKAKSFGDGRFYITALPLYSFGDVLLLCPSSLKGTSFKDWPKLSDRCLATRNSDMRLAVPKPLSEQQSSKVPVWFQYIRPPSLRAHLKPRAESCIVPLQCRTLT